MKRPKKHKAKRSSFGKRLVAAAKNARRIARDPKHPARRIEREPFVQRLRQASRFVDPPYDKLLLQAADEIQELRRERLLAIGAARVVLKTSPAVRRVS